MTDNHPPAGDDSSWDHPDDENETTAIAPPTSPTQPIPAVQPTQPWGGYAAPDAYQSGGYPPAGAWPPAQPQPYQPYPPNQPYPSSQPYPPNQPYSPGPAWAGQQQGFAPPYAPPAATKPRRTGLFILLGVVGLCIALVVGALALRPTTPTTGTGGAGGGGTSGGGTTVTATASDAVKGYLEALAAGDAATALGYAATTPQDQSLLTDEVLAAGNAIEHISDIVVEPTTVAGSAQVRAHYSIGAGNVIDADYSVVRTNAGWKLDKGAAQVTVDRFPSVATINGVTPAPADTITMFPGSYRIGTADDRYRVSAGSFIVQSVTDVASIDVAAALSKSGVAAVRDAAQKHLNACIKQNKALPSASCGFGVKLVERTTGRKITARTVRWRITSGKTALKSFTPKLDASDPTLARGKATVKLRVDITATSGQRYWGTSTISSVLATLGDNTIDIDFGS